LVTVKALVVFVHPDPDEFFVGLRDTAMAALRDAGNQVEMIDPYRDGFEAAMSATELNAYATEDPALDPVARRYADLVTESRSIAFVFPMWWSGPPSMLKGFFDRVLVPGVAFRMSDDGRIHPGLTHVHDIMVIAAAEPPGHFPHRSTRHLATRFARSLRRATGRRTRTLVEWAGPGIRGNHEAEAGFIRHVDRQLRQRSTGGAR
jgi:putative NADPH-quinone reductase